MARKSKPKPEKMVIKDPAKASAFLMAHLPLLHDHAMAEEKARERLGMKEPVPASAWARMLEHFEEIVELTHEDCGSGKADQWGQEIRQHDLWSAICYPAETPKDHELRRLLIERTLLLGFYLEELERRDILLEKVLEKAVTASVSKVGPAKVRAEERARSYKPIWKAIEHLCEVTGTYRQSQLFKAPISDQTKTILKERGIRDCRTVGKTKVEFNIRGKWISVARVTIQEHIFTRPRPVSAK